jgi:hypothetical protein
VLGCKDFSRLNPIVSDLGIKNGIGEKLRQVDFGGPIMPVTYIFDINSELQKDNGTPQKCIKGRRVIACTECSNFWFEGNRLSEGKT